MQLLKRKERTGKLLTDRYLYLNNIFVKVPEKLLRSNYCYPYSMQDYIQHSILYQNALPSNITI